MAIEGHQKQNEFSKIGPQAFPKTLSIEAQELWAQLRKEGEPVIKVKILLAHHQTAKDFELAKSNFADCDIYIPEFEGYSEADIQALNKISEGNIELSPARLEDAARNPISGQIETYQLELLKKLYKSKKIVTLVDTPNERKAYESYLFGLYSLSQQKTFQGKVEALRASLERINQSQLNRDIHIVAHIPKKVREILDANPSLKTKKEINIQMTLGTLHSPVYGMIKELAPKSVERRFENPIAFNFLDEAMRRLRYGEKAEDLGLDLLAHAVLEWEAAQFFQKQIFAVSEQEGSQFAHKKLREYVKLFSTEEIGQFYKKVANGKNFRSLFLLSLRQKGVALPFELPKK